MITHTNRRGGSPLIAVECGEWRYRNSLQFFVVAVPRDN